MIKSISLIVLTQFFHSNELKILRQPGYFIFFKLNRQFFLYSAPLSLRGVNHHQTSHVMQIWSTFFFAEPQGIYFHFIRTNQLW